MPVSVCDSSINAAIRDSITNTTNNYINSSGSKNVNNNDNDTDSLQNKLAASAKRVLLSKIEYEEVNNYSQSVLETLKSKYIVLKPLNSSGKLNNQQQNNNDKDTNQNTTITATTTSGQQNGQQQQRHTNELPQPKRCLFPRENVQIGWRNSNRKWLVGAGMMNVGNTCYLNSTLQAVFHVPAMANWLMSDTAHREKCEDENGSQGGCIICAMSKTLIASQTNQTSAIRPYLVYTKLKLICKHLIMGRQEDAHEFLRYLVEAMEKSYLTRTRNYKELDQYSKETTPLNQILGGYLKSAVRCLACGHVSTTFQHFQDLLLDIRKANTLEEALDGYFARERLEDMGYKCEACKKKVSATKQFSLERAPISLCVQLKRFSMMGTKLNKHITIRSRLDLTKYSSKKNNNDINLTYKLVAMVTHLGASQHCGHYTAIGFTDAGGYYQFDDSCVRPISLQNVLNTNAYIMFYELDEQQTNSRQTSTQTSGEHEKYKENFNNKTNGHGNNNNENVHNNQQQRVNSFTTNNNYQNSKLISKLEISSENSPSTANNNNSNINNNNSNTNGNRIIGPQLPDEFKHLTTSNGCTNNNNKLSNPQSPNKCNNKTNGESSLTKWNKLEINFKNSTTINNSTTLNNSQLNNNKFQDTNSSTKLVNKVKTNKNENNNNNDYNTDDCNKSTEIIKINNKSTLPSMPKLLGSPKDEKTNINLNNNNTTTNNKNINKTNNLVQLQNGLMKSPIKSLVPYESDDDDEDDDDDQNNDKNHNKIYNNKTTEIQNGNNNNITKRDSSLDKMNNNKRKSNFDDESTSDSSPEIKRSKHTPPSPSVVKTKAGLWQVTTLETSKSVVTTPNTNSISTTNSERKNPFATAPNSIATTNFYSSKFNGGGKEKKLDNYSNKIPEDRGPAVTELLKYSHRGYGAPVLNWNGQKTDMEKEISEDIKMERKRELEDDEENEMDRGKQKKVKIHGPHNNNNNNNNNNKNNNRTDNPGFNPFQEQQLQNNQSRRWNGSNHHNNNGRFQHQNNGYRHNNNNNHYNRNHNNNNNNNFRRNKYQQQQRSHHHQRNGGWR